MNHNSILDALNKEFSTNICSVFVNSLNQEVSFRDVTVKEQKTLAKILIDNEGREDVVYESTLAMIQSLSLTEGFRVVELNDFDRIKLLIALYRQNFFNNSIKYTCPKCGYSGDRELDFDEILKRLDGCDVSDRVFSIENATHKFTFQIGFPNVKKVSNYLKQVHKEKTDKNVINKLTMLDYIDLYIKTLTIGKKNETDETKSIVIDFKDYGMNQVEETLALLPQGIIFGRNANSLSDKISKEFMEFINTAFNKHKCGSCGEEISLEVGISDFFTF